MDVLVTLPEEFQLRPGLVSDSLLLLIGLLLLSYRGIIAFLEFIRHFV